MGSSPSKPEETTEQNDVTIAVRKAVGKMVAKAATKKNEGKQFIVDFETCQDYIEQQIDLVNEAPSMDSAIIGKIRYMHNNTKMTLNVPISYSNSKDHLQKHTEEKKKTTELKFKGEAHAGINDKKGDDKKEDAVKKAADDATTAATAAATGGAGAILSKSSGGVNASGEIDVKWEKKTTDETQDEEHKELNVGETQAEANTNAILIPRGEQIYNIPLKLRALKIAEVVCKSTSGKSMTLTAEEIFTEGDKYDEDEEKEGYIICVVIFPYVAEFDLATTENN